MDHTHWQYLAAGYTLSIGLFLAYRAWIAVRRRALERTEKELEARGARLEDDEEQPSSA